MGPWSTTGSVGVAELKGDGGEASEKPDDTPLAKDTQIDALTEDDYFRKNAEARSANLPSAAAACMREVMRCMPGPCIRTASSVHNQPKPKGAVRCQPVTGHVRPRPHPCCL